MTIGVEEQRLLAQALVQVLKEAVIARVEKLESQVSESASAERVSQLLMKIDTLDKRNSLLDQRLRDCEKGFDAHRKHLAALEQKFGLLKHPKDEGQY